MQPAEASEAGVSSEFGVCLSRMLRQRYKVVRGGEGIAAPVPWVGSSLAFAALWGHGAGRTKKKIKIRELTGAQAT